MTEKPHTHQQGHVKALCVSFFKIHLLSDGDFV